MTYYKPVAFGTVIFESKLRTLGLLQDQTKALVLPAKLFVKMFFEILFKDFRLVLGTDQTVAESTF